MVEARFRLPSPAPCGCSSTAECWSSKPAMRVRFPSSAPDSGCRVTGSPPVLGSGRWRFESSHPDQIVAEWTGVAPAWSHKPNHAGSIPASATTLFLKQAAGMRSFSPQVVTRSGRDGERAVRGARTSSEPCHGSDRGFESRTARHGLVVYRLGWLTFNQSNRVRVPARLPMGASSNGAGPRSSKP